uniref:Uncharacterized protein n=1 Tax=Cucumis melo TaxID=3656 RepID=A0A9I9DWF2_CUCME
MAMRLGGRTSAVENCRPTAIESNQVRDDKDCCGDSVEQIENGVYDDENVLRRSVEIKQCGEVWQLM